MKNITFRESIVSGIALGASMLFLIAATPIRNLVFQGNADAGGYQITNLTTGTNANNAATKGYVDSKDGIYAVIWIPLPPGASFTDFELKASADNFAGSSYDFVFWYHSPDPTKTLVTGQVWTNRPDVYFTDSGKPVVSGSGDARSWIKQDATHSIFAMLADAQSEVGGFLVVVRDDLSSYRDHLVWSYSLINASTADKDPSNRVVWRPIWPQEWVNAIDITTGSQ